LGGTCTTRRGRNGRRIRAEGQTATEDCQAGGPERWIIRKTAEQCNGLCIELEEVVPPGVDAFSFSPDRPGGPPLHIHALEKETFTVLEGSFGYVLENPNGTRTKNYAKKGDSVVVPPGLVHGFFNPSPTETLRFNFKLEPPNPMGERFFEVLAGLFRDDHANPLQVVQLFEAGGITFAEPPGALRSLVAVVFKNAAGALGMKTDYDEYIWPCYNTAHRNSAECKAAKCDSHCHTAVSGK